MQDEPVGVTAAQLPPSAQEEEDRISSSTSGGGGSSSGGSVSKSAKRAVQTESQPSSFTSDYIHLTQKISFPEHFCHTQSLCDLQRSTHQQLRFTPAEQFPPPPGRFGHLQPFSSAADPRGSAVEAAEADAATPSPPSGNLNEIQMDSPIAHHLNNGNGSSSSTGSMLSGGLGAAFPNLPSSQEIQSAGGGPSSPSLPGFGTPWSVQTSSSPPPAASSINPMHANAISQMPGADSENSFYPGIPSSINPAFFQSFSPVSANPCAGINVQGFGGPFSPQMNVPQQPQSRRSPVSPQMHPQQGAFLQQRNNYNQHQPMMKASPWGSHQGNGWGGGGGCGGGGMSWGRDHRRGSGMGVPGSVSHASPLKKPFSSNVIAPPKFPRSGGSLGPKSWMEENMFRTDSNSNTMLPLQDRSRMYDSLNMHSLESSLINIMRVEQDPIKARSYGRRRGRSSLFPIDDNLLDDGHGNQGVPGVLGSPNCYPHQNGERIERFSRKVFVGGLPPDIDEDEITSSFRRFGHLVVDWPHKAESKSYFPPKGYAFLLFQEETSVQALIEACMEEDGKLYLCVSSPTIKDKPVQIRPWNLSDSDFVMDGSQPLDPRKTIFVGGVPRPLRAIELAMIMDRLYGGVCYAGIDTDPELKYPKGAGRVAFSNQQSYIAAISARFVQLQHGDIDKRVEVKPYVLDDQLCDECQGARCGGKFAPFFCANVTCLQYYCEFCWANIHSRAGREFHKPLVKEGADRPRQIHFRWN
ncbi:cytoplasmic polyadenylation element-binding protein 2 isoform X3 [Poeciliopsis prolifica]|uniref:cytoplasmic polyadenylation element-binding protein 2 isoform X3 n=1 Tax=Poeciliopsis prolifica TaxID=188132 RepID=UPI0024136ED7|nr:cytoplasmic polyadenylation element-binding protein 2 isoform X3 [Poeciliopsis prolifica]